MRHQLTIKTATSEMHEGSDDAEYIDDGEFLTDSVSILVEGLQFVFDLL